MKRIEAILTLKAAEKEMEMNVNMNRFRDKQKKRRDIYIRKETTERDFFLSVFF